MKINFIHVAVLSLVLSCLCIAQDIKPNASQGEVDFLQFNIQKPSHYYFLLSKKQLDNSVVTLSDLDVVTSLVDLTQSRESNVSSGSINKLFQRWGKKPSGIVKLYSVIERPDPDFKLEFEDIFKKKIKNYQVLCVTYTTSNPSENTRYKALDPHGLWVPGAFSMIDVWIVDEDNKWYVLMGYDARTSLKGNLNQKILSRLGIHDAKLWK